MKLAILTHNYPTPDNPSAGIFIIDHQDYLQKQTPDLECRVHNFPFGEYPMTAAIKKPWKWPKFFFYFALLPWRVRRAIRGADTILAHWWLPAGMAAALVKRGRPLEVVCHGTDLYLLRKHSALARKVSFLAHRVDRWQCVSRDLKDILIELYPALDRTRIRVEPMPVASDFYDLKLVRPGNLIVSCGALIKRKRFDRLIREMTRLPELQLRIFGEGPERPVLEALVSELGLQGRVELPGNVSRQRLNTEFNLASLFVLLSVDEGFGMVLKEAQKAGCPTMACAWDGMVDTLLDFPVSEGDDIAGQIKQALTR